MRHSRKLSSALLGATSVSLLAVPAWAAADPGLLPTETEVVLKKDERPQGWDPALLLGASLALSANSNFVGQPNGNTFTGGLNVLGRLDYYRDVIDWRNTLKIDEVFTRTPVIDEFVKTIDKLTFESVLYLRYSPVIGPFASFKLDTAILEGRDVRAEPTNYWVDGVADPERQGVTSTKLTDAFQPLQLKEAVGVFISPVNTKPLSVDIRAGFGAAQTFAAGGLIINDDEATGDRIELTTLKDVIQAGVVAGVDVKGELDQGRVNYSVFAEVMVPFINDDAQDRSVGDLINVDIGAKMGFKMFEWASLNYELKVMRLPQLVEDWQIQNNLLLTFSYSLID